MTLPFDIARCHGFWHPQPILKAMRLHDQCIGCLRHSSPGHPERQWYIGPPKFVDEQCPSRIGTIITKYLVVAGDPIDGLTFYGSFDYSDEAISWAEDEFNNVPDWWIAPLVDTQEPTKEVDARTS